MILIDFSQLCVAAYAQGSKGFDGTDSDLDMFRYMVINSIRLVSHRFKSQYGQPVLAVDCTDKSWRKQVFPYYKAQRAEAKAKSAINWQQMAIYVNTIRKEVDQCLPYPVVQVSGAEGDDVIGVLARKSIAEDKPVLISSADKDFIQLQIGTDLVSQWDNTHQKWISDANPSRYLFDHVLKGDRGDGIPNVLCEDDHFITKLRKAPAMTSDRLNAWWDNMAEDVRHTHAFKRNLTLVDLRRTPKDLQQQILAQYNDQPDRDKSQLMGYLIKHRLKTLAPSIGEF